MKTVLSNLTSMKFPIRKTLSGFALKYIAIHSFLAVLLCLPVSVRAFEDSDLLDEEAALLAEIKQQLNSPQPPTQQQAAPIEIKKPTETIAAEPIVKTQEAASKSVNDVSNKSDSKKAEKGAIKAALKENTVIQSNSSAAPVNTLQNVKTEDLLDENATLKSTLLAKEAQMADLQIKLSKQRDELIMTQSELERISRLVDKKRSDTLKEVTGLQFKAPVAAPQQVTAPAPAKYARNDVRRVADTPAQAEKMTSDMTIATVTSEKANLRTGPGTNNSPLMAVSKGTRLAVETRQGDWYRVIAPTGARAWVSADVVGFGHNRFSEPSRTLKVKGYSSAEEDDAIKLIKRSLR